MSLNDVHAGFTAKDGALCGAGIREIFGLITAERALKKNREHIVNKIWSSDISCKACRASEQWVNWLIGAGFLRGAQCTKCERMQPFSAFDKRKDSRTGYRRQCRDCRNTYKREHRAKQKAVLDEINEEIAAIFPPIAAMQQGPNCPCVAVPSIKPPEGCHCTSCQAADANIAYPVIGGYLYKAVVSQMSQEGVKDRWNKISDPSWEYVRTVFPDADDLEFEQVREDFKSWVLVHNWGKIVDPQGFQARLKISGGIYNTIGQAEWSPVLTISATLSLQGLTTKTVSTELPKSFKPFVGVH